MASVSRLYEQIKPERYALDIDVDLEGLHFAIKEQLDFELAAPERDLVLHASKLDVKEALLDGTLKAIKIVMDDETQTVTCEFDQEIPAGQHSLALVIEGDISDTLHGFYRSNYTVDGRTEVIATTQFEAVHAREAFVCVDEPMAKAVFEVSLTIPDDRTAISNGDVTSEEPAGAGRKRVSFAASPRMSTYLLAYVVGRFEHLEATTPEGVVVRVHATPGKTSQLGFALETAVRTLSFYTKYFGIPYPLPELDMIAIPDFGAGAMENWGAVTYRETDLLLDPAKTSLANKQRVATVVMHELAHQWFGNLVTLAWWDDLWLNEGFASWIEVFAMDELFPEWQAWDDFVSTTTEYAMGLDGLANTHPIQVHIDDPRSLDEIFDAISYAKGAAIINMLHQYLGAKAFREGLHVYLERHRYGNTVTGDLWKALEEVSGKPVATVMSAWTARPGYPVVRVAGGSVTQERFYSSPREAAKAQGHEPAWPVPFGVVLPDGTATEQTLVIDDLKLPQQVLAHDWFKPNPGQTAFFRTLYTESMLDTLEGPLHRRKLSARDRYGVASDVFATTEAGLTNTTQALRLVELLREEPDYVVWTAVSGGFGAVLAIVEDEDLRTELEEFGRWLSAPNVKRLGWDAKEGESAFDQLMRPLVLHQAVRFDDEAVTEEGKKRFEQYLEGAAIDPDIRSAILYAAARHGGEREFEAVLARYRAEETPQVKLSLLGALGRFRKPELIKRFLELGISPDVRPQDIFSVLAHGFRNHEARDITWAFVKEHWPLFLERYGGGGHMLERFPTYAGMGFATHEMAAEIKAFFAKHTHPGIKRPAAQAVESVELKADWYDRDKAEIMTFIKEWSAKK
ncbi:MAG TPA: M1 family metallopeptidase [Candidatus Saccharimonadia bacterium]|jgi:puromycin-sensitive aminopeptidase|nr:M1 family metallopeptidase [Candidatus Saccharimonadia bacterium]